MTVIEGVDYAWSAPSAAGLAAAGKKFAVRYGGPGSSGKQLKSSELRALRAAGLDVVANAEGSAGGFHGQAAGISWARQAQTYFTDLGMPAGRPVYFSVDWNADSTDWAGIDAACRGAASVIGADMVGVYGGYNTIAHCSSAGTAKWFWQTYAWSAGKWHPDCHMQQYRNGVTVAGGSVDLTRAVKPDYGQWGYQGGDLTTVDLTPAALTAVADAVKKALTTSANFTDAPGGNHNPISDAVWNAVTIPDSSGKRVNAWKAATAALTAPDAVDVAKALTQPLAAALAPLLPTGATVDDAQLQAAVLGAFKALAGGQA